MGEFEFELENQAYHEYPTKFQDGGDNHNVWVSLFKSVIEYSTLPTEDADEIVAGALLLAQRRANLLNRDLLMWQDVPFCLSIFCWWPFKPALSETNKLYLLKERWALFEGASSNPDFESKLLKVIPDNIMTLDIPELTSILQYASIENIINVNAAIPKEGHFEL